MHMNYVSRSEVTKKRRTWCFFTLWQKAGFAVTYLTSLLTLVFFFLFFLKQWHGQKCFVLSKSLHRYESNFKADFCYGGSSSAPTMKLITWWPSVKMQTTVLPSKGSLLSVLQINICGWLEFYEGFYWPN